MPGKCHVINKHLYNFEARLWKCYHMIMNSLQFRFSSTLTERWRNVLTPTSRTRCEFDIVVTKLNLRCGCNIHDLMYGESFIQR